MKRLIEFDCIIYLKIEEDQQEQERLADLGIYDREEAPIQEKVVKYSFDPSSIVEVRETFVKYENEWRSSVVATFTDKNYETPPLLCTYEEFKFKLNEYNKKNT